jgi:fucose 4-O-acetylase-like acetyltransferase
MSKKRNSIVDIMRGIAILMVVLGHTMTGCTQGAEKSFLYNIVWSLQMPLFMLISGYVTKYSREIDNVSSFWDYVKRRTVAYLLPWAVWSFLIRGLILGQHDYLNIRWMLWHMDYGYWFLFTIWTISMIFGCARFVAVKAVKHDGVKRQTIFLLLYVTGMALLAVTGRLAGLSFLAIKLTLYYMPFYYAGYLFGVYSEHIFANSFGKKAVDITVAVSGIVWIFFLTRYHIFELPDGGISVIIRAFASMSGCIAVCGLGSAFLGDRSHDSGVAKAAVWVGTHSLEIYLAHYIFLDLLKMKITPVFSSVSGVSLTMANWLIAVVGVSALILIIEKNQFFRLCLYGRKK